MPKIISDSKIPTFDSFMKPVVQSLKELGGSGSIEEINNKVYEILKLDDEIIQTPHGNDSARTEVEYRLAWTRSYLKVAGVLNNSTRGVWSLVNPKINPDLISPSDIVKQVRDTSPTQPEKKRNKIDLDSDNIWKQELLKTVLKISPSAFERLAQRLLRENGFIQVVVTGKTGDGGIDGKGIVRINGVLSFHVIFQCKRYKRAVPPKDIRDFRGAMQGRADKGLFITTSTFTREAVREATRDGAPAIDLIDGETLCEKLKELNLGVTIKQVSRVEIDNEWFKKL